jgi:ADP-heptose:LPS heptosyltransferase
VLLPFGIDPESTDLRSEIFLNDDERTGAERTWPVGPGSRLLVNLSARSAERRWPDERFIAAVEGMIKRCGPWNVVIIGAPIDRSSADAIADALRNRGISCVAARTPAVHDAFALVASAQIVLTPDTSITHAASAFRIPTVAMMERREMTWRPYDTPGRIVTTDEKTYAGIPVESVITALCETAAEVASTDIRGTSAGRGRQRD